MSLSSLRLIQRIKIHCNGAPLRMTFWMRSAPMHWQWICIREITMRWQGRSSHPNTSTAGSQLSWATPHLLHKSTASWQHLTIHSCKPKDLCCCSRLSRLWFDKSSCKYNFLAQGRKSLYQCIWEYKLLLLAHYDDVKPKCQSNTTLLLSGKASTICQTRNSQVVSYRDSNLCWLPFTVKKAPEWNIPRMTKH